MHELIARHVVREPFVSNYWLQIANADSVAENGVVTKSRYTRTTDLAPSDAQLQIVDGVPLNPFVERFDWASGTWRFDQEVHDAG